MQGGMLCDAAEKNPWLCENRTPLGGERALKKRQIFRSSVSSQNPPDYICRRDPKNKSCTRQTTRRKQKGGYNDVRLLPNTDTDPMQVQDGMWEINHRSRLDDSR